MPTAPHVTTPAPPRRLVEVSKADVLRHYGGITARAARAMFITPSAVSMWPDVGPLPQVMRDRFQAALWREARMKDKARRATDLEDTATEA